MGHVALVGWANVGKSTLLNRLVGTRVAATADVAQTTRHRIIGVLHLPERAQIAFIDTPGLHEPRSRMNRLMVAQSRRAIVEADTTVLLVDAARGLGPGDREAARLVIESARQRLVALNKVDRIRPKNRLLPMMQEIADLGFEAAVPISALTGEGCPALIEAIVGLLPEGPPQYPEDFLTDQTIRSLVAESVREELVRVTRQELPHTIAVLIENWQERAGGRVDIEATILIERESQKAIVIGRGGERLKQVGIAARAEAERLLERQVFLRLWVKVREDWRNDERTLGELGLQ